MTSLYYFENFEKLQKLNSNIEGYYYDRRNKDKLELWFTWRKSFRNDNFNIRYTYEYIDNKLVFTTTTGHWIDFNPSWTRKPIDPFDIVIVTFDDVPEHICDNCLPKGETVLMPAFLFEWICNEYTNQQIIDYLDKSITISSLFFAGAGVVVTKGARIIKVINAVVADRMNTLEDLQKELEKYHPLK